MKSKEITGFVTYESDIPDFWKFHQRILFFFQMKSLHDVTTILGDGTKTVQYKFVYKGKPELLYTSFSYPNTLPEVSDNNKIIFQIKSPNAEEIVKNLCEYLIIDYKHVYYNSSHRAKKDVDWLKIDLETGEWRVECFKY